MKTRNDLPRLAAGAVVAADRGLYTHVGILTEPLPGMERRVISLNPAKQVVEEPLTVFARGQPLRIQGALSSMHPSVVLARARSGQHPRYSWTEFNCEHFLCFAFGVPLQSPQLQKWVALVGLAAVVALIGQRPHRWVSAG